MRQEPASGNSIAVCARAEKASNSGFTYLETRDNPQQYETRGALVTQGHEEAWSVGPHDHQAPGRSDRCGEKGRCQLQTIRITHRAPHTLGPRTPTDLVTGTWPMASRIGVIRVRIEELLAVDLVIGYRLLSLGRN
jgi:hypothetical protein